MTTTTTIIPASDLRNGDVVRYTVRSFGRDRIRTGTVRRFTGSRSAMTGDYIFELWADGNTRLVAPEGLAPNHPVELLDRPSDRAAVETIEARGAALAFNAAADARRRMSWAEEAYAEGLADLVMGRTDAVAVAAADARYEEAKRDYLTRITFIGDLTRLTEDVIHQLITDALDPVDLPTELNPARRLVLFL